MSTQKQKALSEQARNLCYAIEELPAGEKQTEVSLLASAISDRIDWMGSLTLRLLELTNDFIKQDEAGYYCAQCNARLDDGGTHEPGCLVSGVIDLGDCFLRNSVQPE